MYYKIGLIYFICLMWLESTVNEVDDWGTLLLLKLFRSKNKVKMWFAYKHN